MTPAFTLRVPADSRFRALAPELVRRYVEIAGGSEAEREAITRALIEAVDGLAGSSGEALELVCMSRPAGFDLTVRCGGRETVVRHSLAAGKR